MNDYVYFIVCLTGRISVALDVLCLIPMIMNNTIINPQIVVLSLGVLCIYLNRNNINFNTSFVKFR